MAPPSSRLMRVSTLDKLGFFGSSERTGSRRRSARSGWSLAYLCCRCCYLRRRPDRPPPSSGRGSLQKGSISVGGICFAQKAHGPSPDDSSRRLGKFSSAAGERKEERTMESLFTSSAILFPSPSSPPSSSARLLRFPVLSKKNGNDSFPDDRNNLLPVLSDRTLSKDGAMGLVLSAASVGGWTTDSGLEGPVGPTDDISGTEKVSTFPWSLFTKSPRRRMRVAFTCNVCGQRTTRAINPHAYTDGTVFVQCCGCNVFHKLVDNLNLFHDMKCYVNPSFNYKEPQWDDAGIKDDDPSGNDPFLM